MTALDILRSKLEKITYGSFAHYNRMYSDEALSVDKLPAFTLKHCIQHTMHFLEEENGFQLVDTLSFTNSVIKIYLMKRPSNYECIQGDTYKVYNKRERENTLQLIYLKSMNLQQCT